MTLLFGPLAQPPLLTALPFTYPRNAVPPVVEEERGTDHQDAAEEGGGGFPVQFAGLRAQKVGSIIDLCLVAAGDAQSGMGGVVRVRKVGVTYDVYLVETTDPNASPVRVKTTTGVKSVRLKT